MAEDIKTLLKPLGSGMLIKLELVLVNQLYAEII